MGKLGEEDAERREQISHVVGVMELQWLSDWEEEFLDSVLTHLHGGGMLTERQLEKLREIEEENGV